MIRFTLFGVILGINLVISILEPSKYSNSELFLQVIAQKFMIIIGAIAFGILGFGSWKKSKMEQ